MLPKTGNNEFCKVFHVKNDMFSHKTTLTMIAHHCFDFMLKFEHLVALQQMTRQILCEV